jgi:hypothetical protein
LKPYKKFRSIVGTDPVLSHISFMSNFSNRTDLIELIVGMLERLVVLNDLIPSATTRFHSLSAPSISINDYLLRIYKYVIVERAVLIQILVYLDRMCIRLPGFSFNSLTSHRCLFLI